MPLSNPFRKVLFLFLFCAFSIRGQGVQPSLFGRPSFAPFKYYRMRNAFARCVAYPHRMVGGFNNFRRFATRCADFHKWQSRPFFVKVKKQPETPERKRRTYHTVPNRESVKRNTVEELPLLGWIVDPIKSSVRLKRLLSERDLNKRVVHNHMNGVCVLTRNHVRGTA